MKVVPFIRTDYDAGTDTPAGAVGIGTPISAGDLSGTHGVPLVAGIGGVSISGTPAAGEVLTATSGTAANWATPSPFGSRAYNSVAFSVPASAETPITLDSERSDSGGFHSVSVNTSRMTVPAGAGGRYSIAGTVEWAASALGTLRRLSIRLNGATYVAKDEITSILNVVLPQSVATVYDLVVTDYVELVAFQDTAVAVNVDAAPNYSPEFAVALLK